MLPVPPGDKYDSCEGVVGVLVTTHAKGPPDEPLPPEPFTAPSSPEVPVATGTVPLAEPTAHSL